MVFSECVVLPSPHNSVPCRPLPFLAPRRPRWVGIFVTFFSFWFMRFKILPSTRKSDLRGRSKSHQSSARPPKSYKMEPHVLPGARFPSFGELASSVSAQSAQWSPPFRFCCEKASKCDPQWGRGSGQRTDCFIPFSVLLLKWVLEGSPGASGP